MIRNFFFACVLLSAIPALAQVPGPPVNLTAKAESDSTYSLTWSPPSGGGSVDGYVVRIGTTSGGSEVGTFQVGPSVTSYRTAVVPGGMRWFARVLAYNGFGFSNPSNEVVLDSIVACQVPSAPLGLTWRVFPSGVQMTWARPLQPSDANLYRFRLRIGTTSGSSNVVVYETSSEGTIAGFNLPSGSYFARVAAFNQCGVEGPASTEVVIDMAAVTAPSTSMVVNELGKSAVELRNVSGSAIDLSNWFIRSTSGAPWQIGTFFASIPSGTMLPAGCTYLVSPAGADLPFDLQGGSAKEGAALARANGNIIDSAGLRRDDGQDGSHSPFIEGQGLRASRTWEVMGVGSVARSGADRDNNAADFIELNGSTLQGLEGCPGTPVPPPPTGVSATVDAEQRATVSWSRTASTSGYVVELGTVSGSSNVVNTFVGNISRYRTPPLKPGTYYARVRARNISGTSGPSAEAVGTIAAGPPSTPLSLQATVDGTRVTLQWTEPTTGGSVAEYILEAGSGSNLSDLFNASVGNVTSLVAEAGPGVYFVRVRARNSLGTSAPSNEIVVTIGSTLLPGPPQNPTYTSGPGGRVTVSWTPPGSGGAVVDYIIEAGRAPGSRDIGTLPVGSVTSMTFTSVPPGTYHVRIRARNAYGQGPPSVDIVVVVP